MGGRVTCMGTLHPRTIYLFDFENLDTGKQKPIAIILFEESHNVRFVKISEPTTNTTRLVGYVYECS